MEDNDRTATGGNDRPEVTIKFGKGLVGESFTSKSGKQLVEVSIPNQSANDHRPWQTFVVAPGMIHDNKFGKGVWMKLPEDGETKVSRPVLQGQDETGKNVWSRESRMVPNTELKSMLEAYKEKSRDSVLSDLSSKQTAAAHATPTAPKRAAHSKDASR